MHWNLLLRNLLIHNLGLQSISLIKAESSPWLFWTGISPSTVWFSVEKPYALAKLWLMDLLTYVACQKTCQGAMKFYA